MGFEPSIRGWSSQLPSQTGSWNIDVKGDYWPCEDGTIVAEGRPSTGVLHTLRFIGTYDPWSVQGSNPDQGRARRTPPLRGGSDVSEERGANK
jgi:hypothetical protein